MNRKSIKYSFAIILVVISASLFFAYQEYNRKHTDVANIEANYKLQSDDIIHAFSSNEKMANSLYIDKVVAVDGIIKSIDKDEKNSCTIVLGKKNSMASVRCMVDSIHVIEAKKLKEGTQITVKGICTGFNADELLGSDVILNRCTL